MVFIVCVLISSYLVVALDEFIVPKKKKLSDESIVPKKGNEFICFIACLLLIYSDIGGL